MVKLDTSKLASHTHKAANASGWADVTAPVAPLEDHIVEQLGRVRNDAFAWMKYVPETGSRTMDNLPPQLREHLVAESDYARQILDPLSASKDVFFHSMSSHAHGVDRAPSVVMKGWTYQVETVSGSGHKVFLRTHRDGRTETLVDEPVRARGHVYYRATDHQHSPDDRYFVWAEDLVGNDRHRICVLDMHSSVSRVLVEGDAFGYGGLTFSPSSQDLFWIWRDAFSRPSRLYRSPVEGGDAVLVHEERDPALFMRVARTAANGFVALSLFGPDTSEVRLLVAGDEHAPAKVLRERECDVRYEVDEWDGSLITLTNADGATDRKILRLDATLEHSAQTLVPHRLGVPIISMVPFETTLVRLERVEGLHRLVLLQRDGREIPIVFNEASYVLELPASQRWDATHVRVIHQTMAQPPLWLDVRLSDGEITEVGREYWSDLSSEDYQVERMMAMAEDGETVPITVLSRKGVDDKRPRPLLLTGYGAYGIACEPVFSLPALAWVDAGYRYAMAHVRGGSEKGHDWYQGGCRENKRNSMTDFIACAQHLCRIGYTTPAQTVAYGVSAGGLLVCGAANMKPEQWAGVIAQVPFVDMLNTMSDADHPLVPLLRPDWGDPLADPAAYDAMAAISPYENVPNAAYPPILCTAGLKDDRVPYWEPAKLLANIRLRSTSGAPALLLLNPDSGHQESDQQEHAFMQAACFWAFAQHCVRDVIVNR